MFPPTSERTGKRGEKPDISKKMSVVRVHLFPPTSERTGKKGEKPDISKKCRWFESTCSHQ